MRGMRGMRGMGGMGGMGFWREPKKENGKIARDG